MKRPPLKPGQYRWDKKLYGRGIFMRGQPKGLPRYGCSYMIPAPVAQRFGISRRRRELAGVTLGSARKLLARRKTQLWEKDYSFLAPPPQAVPTVRQFVARYLEHAKATKKSWAFDEAQLKGFVARHGDRAIDTVLPAMIDQHKATRARDVSARTVNHELQIIHALFAAAVRWGVLERNPAGGAKRMKVPQKTIRVLSVEEEPLLLAAAPDHLRDLIVLVLHTGLRKSEALALKGSHVDLDERILTVAAGKGDKVRHVPLNDTAAALLRRRVRGQGYVFTWEKQPIKDVKVAWGQTVRRAGITGLTFHNLRDTFATRAVHLGVNLVTLKDLLGHASVTMTEKYAHPTPEANRDAVRRLEEAFGAKA